MAFFFPATHIQCRKCNKTQLNTNNGRNVNGNHTEPHPSPVGSNYSTASRITIAGEDTEKSESLIADDGSVS